MSTLTTSRPRVKAPVTRFARVDGNFLFDGHAILTLTVGEDATDYTIERIGSDWGDGIMLTKHVGHPDAETADIYHVHLSDDGHTCDCRGGTYSTPKTGKPCKHVAALVALRHAGKI